MSQSENNVKAASAPEEGITILQEEGFLCHVQMHSKLDIKPSAAYGIISDPDNARMFRNIDECTHRKVVHDDGRGKKRVEVEHRSSWRFLWHRGEFRTRLLVEQDDAVHVMAFKLAGPGFMKNFEGFWRMEPYPGQSEATLAVLHQNVLPHVSAPGLNWVLKKICKGQIEAMLEDVRAEVRRLNSGDPIPKHQQEKMKGKKSWADPQINGFQIDIDDSDDEASPSAAATTTDGSSTTQETSAAVPAAKDNWELLQAAERNMITASPQPAEETSGENE